MDLEREELLTLAYLRDNLGATDSNRSYDECRVCPYCGFEMVHPFGVSVNAGGEWTHINSEGRKYGMGKPWGRGVYIELRFYCEQGCIWREWYHFHKGSTFIGNEFVAKMDVNSDEFPSTIWRD